MSDVHSPKYLAWTIVNLAVVLFATILFVDILRAGEDRKERPGAVAEYLVYNFGTSVLWVVEISLSFYENSKNQSHDHAAKKWIVAEWIVALYFVCDSIHLLVEWKLKEKDLTGNLVDAFTGIISYSYLALSTFQAYNGSKPRSDYEQIPPEPSKLSTLVA